MLKRPDVGAEHEAEPVTTDLQLVAVVQDRFVGTLAVDVGAVERADVADT